MIRSATSPGPAPGKSRAKQRSKKTFADADDADDFGNKQKAKYRRAAQKRREDVVAAVDEEDEHQTYHEMRELPLGPENLHLMQHLYQGQRYDAETRLLPDIEGLKTLTAHEAQTDIKSIQQQLAAFEARSGIKLLDRPSAIGDEGHRRLVLVDENDSDEDVAPLGGMLKNRRSRSNGVITPEEIVETLPAARRAVRITQRELQEMKIEREDLEREFMKHRCTLVWQVGEMKRMQKQNARVTRALSRDVIEKAKDLESSRRRNSALQDIMNELEARGNNVLRLTREKSRLEAMLEERDIELPEIDEVCAGDRVKCAPFGQGRVIDLRLDARQLVVQLDFGARAYVQEDNVEVLPSDVSYTEMEEQLKQRFFEKIGALVHPNGKLRMLSGAVDYTHIDSDDEDNSDDDSDEESLSEEDSEDSRPAVDVSQRKPKKRRLIMTASPGSTSKKPRNRRVIEFPASTIPITPYETGLLISPLSELPERVAAVGPGALQWLPSYLPKNMDEWEKERLSSLQMKGEIERLRFQLQRAEAEKQDAQEIASDQLESINQLVSQLDKLRDKIDRASTSTNSKSASENTCTNCGNHSKSNSKSQRTNHHGRVNNKKDTTLKRTRDDSGDEVSDTNSKSSKADDDHSHSEYKRSTRRKHSETSGADEAGEESSDAAPTQSTKTAKTAKTTKRSLRPRRKATTASPKR